VASRESPPENLLLETVVAWNLALWGQCRHSETPNTDPWLTYTHSEKRLSPLMAISLNVTCNLSAHIDEAASAGHGVVLIAIVVS